ncbi:hypothetical protein NDA15_005330 [Ustilago hordei]|nr:hypothetical protein NDA15_005330 [Ustilago hordei]
MKEMPKLTTKNCITKPGDKKFNWKLDRNLSNDSRDSSQQQTSKQRHYQNDLTPMININHGNSAMTSSMNDVAILGMIRHR